MVGGERLKKACRRPGEKIQREAKTSVVDWAREKGVLGLLRIGGGEKKR